MWRQSLSARVPGEFSPWERETLEHFVIIGHEVAQTAYALRARYVSVHLQLSTTELVAFTYEDGHVWVTGRGYERELSGLAEW